MFESPCASPIFSSFSYQSQSIPSYQTKVTTDKQLLQQNKLTTALNGPIKLIAMQNQNIPAASSEHISNICLQLFVRTSSKDSNHYPISLNQTSVVNSMMEPQ